MIKENEAMKDRVIRDIRILRTFLSMMKKNKFSTNQ